MTQLNEQQPLDSELSQLSERRDALRQAARVPGARLRPTLEAALADLDAAIDALAAAGGGSGNGPDTGALHAERRLLRAIFADAPVPLFLLERDATIRRVNRAAAEFLGTGTGYATGKQFTAFVNLTSRAAVRTQLAAAIRTGTASQIRCELLTPDGAAECDLTAGPAQVPGDDDRLIVAIGGPARMPAAHTEPTPEDRAPVAAMTRRLDLVTGMTRLLLDNATQNEAVMLQRCARLLADGLAAWVIVDLGRGGRLRRQVVMGPEDQRSAELAAEIATCDPPPGSLPATVSETGSSQLIAHPEDAGVLGDGPGGVPLLMLLDVTTVLSVPLTDGVLGHGSLTLGRQAGQGHFELADLGLMEELGEQLALAIKVSRKVRRHAEVSSAVRASLLPPRLPSVPGTEIANAHLATEGPGMGGDFYDVYPTSTGWGLSIGDVCGRGEGVAAAGAAARHAIRVIGHSAPDPAATLTAANSIMLTEDLGGRFVTACAAHLVWQGETLLVTLGCAGHPGPVLVRPDGRAHQLRGGGQPLGIFPDVEIGSQQQELAPGDVLIFFTDGLADARSAELGYFGDRLVSEAAALASKEPESLLARLQELVLDFCRGDLRDDISMLAIRAGEPPGAG